VVENRDTEQEPSLPGVARQLHIVSRRRRIRRHVIVDQDYRGSVGADGVAEAIGQSDGGLGLAALINEWRVDQSASTIEQDDAQLLLGQVNHLGTEIGCNVSRFAKGGTGGGWCETIGFAAPGQRGQQPTVLAQRAHQCWQGAALWWRTHAACRRTAVVAGWMVQSTGAE
jgi:hypothetical protein